MASVLEELGALHISRPGIDAGVSEVAAWHERRAVMLEHAGALGELDPAQAFSWALAAHQRGGCAAEGGVAA